MVATRRLVVHLPEDLFDGAPPSGGPRDGDPVDLPAPCARVRAGYSCPCGRAFIHAVTWETLSFARVVPLGGGWGSKYVDDREGGWEAPVPCPSVDDQDELAKQLEALEIGTVAERHGIGIARRFEEERGRVAAPAWDEPWPC